MKQKKEELINKTITTTINILASKKPEDLTPNEQQLILFINKPEQQNIDKNLVSNFNEVIKSYYNDDKRILFQHLVNLLLSVQKVFIILQVHYIMELVMVF